jgi:hypothetical protein
MNLIRICYYYSQINVKRNIFSISYTKPLCLVHKNWIIMTYRIEAKFHPFPNFGIRSLDRTTYSSSHTGRKGKSFYVTSVTDQNDPY